MTELDVKTLQAALNNENNERIMDLDEKTIETAKYDMLEKLDMSNKDLSSMKKSLKLYRYVDELPDLNFGAYVRWIPLKDVEVAKLTSGGFVCDVKIDNGIISVCKNKQNFHFQFKMGDCLIFQKLSEQERVLLSAMNYLTN